MRNFLNLTDNLVLLGQLNEDKWIKHISHIWKEEILAVFWSETSWEAST